MNCAPCSTEKAFGGVCVSWDLEVLSKIFKWSLWFDELFLTCLSCGFWGKAHEMWALPVAGWEAAAQPLSAEAHLAMV